MQSSPRRSGVWEALGNGLLQGGAVSAVKSLKAGQQVHLTCLDNEKGEHQAVTAISAARAKK